MSQIDTQHSDQMYDALNGTETARAWDENRCIAMLRLPKGDVDVPGELTDLLRENNAVKGGEFEPETETARAWDGDRCIAVLMLPKGDVDVPGELTDLLRENSAFENLKFDED
jgi:hypothetical protein